MRASYGAEIELGRSLFEYLTSASDLEGAKEHLARALRGETVTVEAHTGDPRLTQRWSAITQAPVRDGDGRIIGVAVVSRDISERRRVENELREKEEQFQAVLDNSPFGMHIYRLEDDDRLVFTGSNRTAGAMLGIDHAVLVGMTLEEAFPGNAGTETAAAYHRVAREGGRYESHEYAYDAEGIAVCEMLYDDEHRPVDWVYLDVNPAFETMTGRGDLVGARFSETFPERPRDDPGLLDIYGGVAGGGEPTEFETYSRPLDLWLHVSAFGLAPAVSSRPWRTSHSARPPHCSWPSASACSAR
jgi:PAS domain-containing protein